MTTAQIRLILETEKEKAAEKVVAAVLKAVPTTLVSTSPYAKGGTEATLALEIKGQNWSEQVLELVRTAQYLGYGWHITGSIDDEISLTSERFRFTGIQWACIEASKDG